jgi:hypothetical protein
MDPLAAPAFPPLGEPIVSQILPVSPESESLTRFLYPILRQVGRPPTSGLVSLETEDDRYRAAASLHHERFVPASDLTEHSTEAILDLRRGQGL